LFVDDACNATHAVNIKKNPVIYGRDRKY